MVWFEELALQPASHERPSNRPLTENPQKLGAKKWQTLTIAPQKVWQTLKNFDYPYFVLG